MGLATYPSMLEVSQRNFGLLIAYVVPGVIMLWGMSFVVPDLRPWLLQLPSEPPTFGGFLYLLLAGITLGMLTSVVRWAVIDSIHHATGLPRPEWSDEMLDERLEGYDWIVENHYRYYQFYANTLVALLASLVLWRASLPNHVAGIGWFDFSIVILAAMLFAGSRSALKLGGTVQHSPPSAIWHARWCDSHLCVRGVDQQ